MLDLIMQACYELEDLLPFSHLLPLIMKYADGEEELKLFNSKGICLDFCVMNNDSIER